MPGRVPKRTRGPSPRVADFLRLVDGKMRIWNTVERFGLTPREYQGVLYHKADWVNKKFLLRVSVRSQCEGDELVFCLRYLDAIDEVQPVRVASQFLPYAG